MTRAPVKEVVETASGLVEGRKEEGVSAFFGVPYGARTTGERRFKPASPAERWTGVRDATRWGPRCYQSTAQNPFALAFPRTFQAIEGDDWMAAVPLSEDCLTVNVWTPGVGEEARRPVLFWLHGGGGCGSPSESRSDGSSLARRGDVVVVSVTHRLNVFGYLYLSELGGEEYETSGNAGTLDLVLALEWVRDNIARFGGDAKNITAFGESAGGAKISCLLALPTARGLFHKAVIQSGADTASGFTVDADRAASFTREFVAELGLTASTWKNMLQLPAGRLVAAHEAIARRRQIPYVLPPPGATIDDVVLRQTPIEAVTRGIAADVPLIMGACEDELRLFTMRTDYVADDGRGSRQKDPVQNADASPLVPTGLTELKRWLGAGAEGIIDSYSSAQPGLSPDEIDAAIRGDRQFLIPSVRYAEAHLATNQSPVFMYLFSWKSDVAPQLGTYHSLDIPFFFDRAGAVPIASGDTSAASVAANVSDALIAFARSGNPDHPGIPRWRPYETETRPTMIFDRSCRVENDPHSREWSSWAEVPTERLGF
jgi:para-nitrobenzyl esterase